MKNEKIKDYALKCILFVKHLRKHLVAHSLILQRKIVICTICNKTIDEIYEESSQDDITHIHDYFSLSG